MKKLQFIFLGLLVVLTLAACGQNGDDGSVGPAGTNGTTTVIILPPPVATSTPPEPFQLITVGVVAEKYGPVLKGLNGDIFVHNGTSTPVNITNSNGAFEETPRISPDGTTVVMTVTERCVEKPSIFTIRKDGTALTRITGGDVCLSNSRDRFPSWGDLGRIFFSRVNIATSTPNEAIFLTDKGIETKINLAAGSIELQPILFGSNLVGVSNDTSIPTIFNFYRFDFPSGVSKKLNLGDFTLFDPAANLAATLVAGSKVYGANESRNIVTIDPVTGAVTQLTGTVKNQCEVLPSFSRDGKVLMYQVYGCDEENPVSKFFIRVLETGEILRITGLEGAISANF